jgi:hypothetical protein
MQVLKRESPLPFFFAFYEARRERAPVYCKVAGALFPLILLQALLTSAIEKGGKAKIYFFVTNICI